jgi:cell wall-associated NlpC family hydrolase
MKKTILDKKNITIVLALILAVQFFCINFNKASANFEGYKARCYTSTTANGSSDGNSDDTDTGSVVNGDWTKKGTKSYEMAKYIFTKIVKDDGFSGAGAAGATGVANRESGYNPLAVNTGGGVAGFFQWSGFSNTVNGSRITSEGSIKAGDKDTLTKENEMKLVHYELTHGYKKVVSTVGKSDDPEEAALKWSEGYEGVSLSDSQTKPEQVKADAKKAYKIFDGASIPSDSAGNAADEGTDGTSSSNATSSECGTTSSSTTGDASDVVSAAKAMLGWFTYNQIHPDPGLGSDLKNPNKDGQTDCSGFVWLALYKAGYNVPANMGWYTKTMADDAKGSHKWLKEIDPDEAGPGDVVIVNTGSGSGNNGHTAILLEKWKGGSPTSNGTKIIQEGGGSDGGVNIGNYNTSFYPGLSGGEVVLARPVKK